MNWDFRVAILFVLKVNAMKITSFNIVWKAAVRVCVRACVGGRAWAGAWVCVCVCVCV